MNTETQPHVIGWGVCLDGTLVTRLYSEHLNVRYWKPGFDMFGKPAWTPCYRTTYDSDGDFVDIWAPESTPLPVIPVETFLERLEELKAKLDAYERQAVVEVFGPK